LVEGRIFLPGADKGIEITVFDGFCVEFKATCERFDGYGVETLGILLGPAAEGSVDISRDGSDGVLRALHAGRIIN
jgi:hypothetical protein